jgi:hypothetical protein
MQGYRIPSDQIGAVTWIKSAMLWRQFANRSPIDRPSPDRIATVASE